MLSCHFALVFSSFISFFAFHFFLFTFLSLLSQMDSFEDDSLICESELDKIWMGGKTDISSCAEILSSGNELTCSPAIPNLWVDCMQERKPDSVQALLNDDAESQQDILKSKN